jgi:hypothetical protein
MGASPATFTASGQAVTAQTGAGVVTDIAAENIVTFGMCMSPANPAVAAAMGAPQPCMPVIPAPWSPGSSSVTINGVPALDDSSQCLCTWNGVITVTDAGQTQTTIQ